MPITSFTATVLGCDSNNITLHMPPATNDFNLSQITIDYNSDVNCFVGCWKNGTALHGGSRSVETDPNDYNRLQSECPPNTNVTVTITYHDVNGQHCIDNIDCAQAALTNILSALAKINSQLEPVSEVRTLREAAVDQLAVQRRILEILEQVRPAPTPPSPPTPWNGPERRRPQNGAAPEPIL